MIYLPSVLVPRFDLGLGERQGVGHVASVCHAQILLTAKLSLQVSELGMGERGSPSSGLPAAWRAAARSARLARSRCRRRWRECWRRTFQSGARAASRVDRVLRVRVNGRIVLGIFWKRKYVLSRIRRIDSCWVIQFRIRAPFAENKFDYPNNAGKSIVDRFGRLKRSQLGERSVSDLDWPIKARRSGMQHDRRRKFGLTRANESFRSSGHL